MLSFNWYTNPQGNSSTLQELCLCHIQWHSQPQHGDITDKLVADRPDNSFIIHVGSRPLLESTDLALWSVLCISMKSGKLPMEPCGLEIRGSMVANLYHFMASATIVDTGVVIREEG